MEAPSYTPGGTIQATRSHSGMRQRRPRSCSCSRRVPGQVRFADHPDTQAIEDENLANLDEQANSTINAIDGNQAEMTTMSQDMTELALECGDDDTCTVVDANELCLASSSRSWTSPRQKKKQRNRSSSVKRRGRPVFRELGHRGRRGNARAPSRSTSGARPQLISKFRARSRSPADSNLRWISSVQGERKAFPLKRVSDLSGIRDEDDASVPPPLRLVQSDDIDLQSTANSLDLRGSTVEFTFRGKSGAKLPW
jgi:hypothetical protein